MTTDSTRLRRHVALKILKAKTSKNNTELAMFLLLLDPADIILVKGTSLILDCFEHHGLTRTHVSCSPYNGFWCHSHDCNGSLQVILARSSKWDMNDQALKQAEATCLGQRNPDLRPLISTVLVCLRWEGDRPTSDPYKSTRHTSWEPPVSYNQCRFSQIVTELLAIDPESLV